MSYGVDAYCAMLADGVRGEAYAKALRQTVEPGSVVLDLGAGTGAFALLAAKLGAARVYAIEPNPAIRLAQELAEANGLAERITVLKARAQDVELPERVDLIVSDLRGWLPLSGDHLVSLAAARDRFLRPEGTLIPKRDRLFCALVAAPALRHDLLVRPTETHFGFDVSPVLRVLANTLHLAKSADTVVVLPGRVWAELDYATLRSPHAEGAVEWTVGEDEAREGHGLLVYFDTVLVDGVGFTTGPEEKDTIYGRAFLPFAEPLRLEAGDTVHVRLEAHLQRDDYLWQWGVDVTGPGASAPREKRRHSTFEASLLHPKDLRRRAHDHVPTLVERGRIDRRILNAFAEGLPLGRVAELLVEEFPGRFQTVDDALGRVGALSERYGRGDG